MMYKGHYHVDPDNPEAYGICDRCGFMYNKSELVFQYDWMGTRLVKQNILVCKRTCLDKPAEMRRTILIPPDPMPVKDPRPLPPYNDGDDE